MATKKPQSNRARKRQMLILGGATLILGGAFVAAMQLADNSKLPPREKPSKPTTVKLDSPGSQATTGASFESAMDAKMAALTALVEDTQANAEARQQKAIEAALAKTKEAASRSGSNQRQPTAATGYKIFDATKLGESLPAANPPSTSATPTAPTLSANSSTLTTVRFEPQSRSLNEQTEQARANSKRLMAQTAESEAAYKAVGTYLRGDRLLPSTDPSAPEKPVQNTETYLPSGTFFQVTNLNGLDAPTGGQAQNNPVPMLLSVTGMGQLPNRFKADVKQCFVTAQGWGDLSSERAYIRTETLSCVRRNGDVVDIPIQGYIVGGDGKVGMRGRVVSKQGQVLANALWVSMLSSFGEVSKAAATTVNVSSAGTITAANGQQSTSDLLRQGALSGLGEAAKTLSNYYISLAEKLWPVIEVDPGQGAEIVLSRGSSLLQASLGVHADPFGGLASVSDQLRDTAANAVQALPSISPTINLNIGGKP